MKKKEQEEEHFSTAKMAFCIYSKASPRTQISQPPQPFCPTRSPEISLPATGRYLEARETNLKRENLFVQCGCERLNLFWSGFSFVRESSLSLQMAMVTFHTLDFLDCRKLAVVTPLLLVGTWARRTFSKLLGCIFFLVFVETFGGLGLILHLLLFVLRYFHFLALSFTTFHSIVLKLCNPYTLIVNLTTNRRHWNLSNYLSSLDLDSKTVEHNLVRNLLSR